MHQDRTIVELLLQTPIETQQETPTTAQTLLNALFELQLAQRRVTADLQQQTGLTESDLIALGLLVRISPAPIKDIVAGLGLTPGSTSTLVDRLVKAGMVDRAQSVQDRRVSLISLTEHGTAIMHSARDRYLFAVGRALEDCTMECLDTTSHVLHGVAAGLTRLPGTPAAPDATMTQVLHAIASHPYIAAQASQLQPTGAR